MDASDRLGLPDGLDPDGAIADPARIAGARRLDAAALALGPTLDAVAAAAIGSLGGSLALVNLIDAQHQLVRGRAEQAGSEGVPAPTSLPISQTFCPYTVAARRVLLVGDLSADARTRTNPVVALGVRAYAGAPVVVDGAAVGTVCVVDQRPRRWTDADGEVLRRLAEDVAAQLRASTP